MMSNEHFPIQLSISVKQEQLLAKKNTSCIDVTDDVKEGIDFCTQHLLLTPKFCIMLLTYLF